MLRLPCCAALWQEYEELEKKKAAAEDAVSRIFSKKKLITQGAWEGGSLIQSITCSSFVTFSKMELITQCEGQAAGSGGLGRVGRVRGEVGGLGCTAAAAVVGALPWPLLAQEAMCAASLKLLCTVTRTPAAPPPHPPIRFTA